MKRKISINKKRGLAIFFVIVILIAVIPPLRNGALHLGGMIISPVASFFYGGSDGISGWFYAITHAVDVHKENQKLQSELNAAKNTIAKYKGLKKENQHLKKLLEITEPFENTDFVGAEIIAKEDGNWFVTFTINKGTADGVYANQPVLCGDGLVGHTTDVGVNWAKVVSLIDTEHAVSGQIVRNGDYVLVEGYITLMHDGKCRMTNITEGADVVVGDSIISSGMGGVYPKDIVIGTVESFEKSESGDGNFAIIKPAVDFQRVQEVVVLKTGADK